MPINYLYIDDEKSSSLKNLIDTLQSGDTNNILIKHIQVKESIKSIVSIINNGVDQNNPFDGIIIDQDLKAKSDEGFYADYFGTTLAQHFRTEMAASSLKYMPLILLSNEDVIVNLYDPDDSSKNLFDYVIKKNSLTKPEKRVRAINILHSLVDAYSKTQRIKNSLGNDITDDEIKALLNCDDKTFSYIDKRFIDFICAKSKDPHAIIGAIYSSLIQSAGMLVTEEMLQTKLGVCKRSDSWLELKTLFEKYKYTGLFSNLKERWWFSRIEDWWFEISPDNTLQSLTCEERVEVLREKLSLKEISPIITRYPDGEQSMYLWVNCVSSGHPLDPYDALRIRDPEAKVWEQQKYIDLKTYLNEFDGKYSIHSDDKNKIKLLIARLKPDVNE